MISRKQIVDALDPVDGVQAYPTPPPAIHPFDCWPQLQLLRWRVMGSCVIESDWWLMVALPAGDLTETIETADALWEQIGAALNRVGAVTEAAPDRIATAGQDGGQPVMRFTFISD